MRHGVDDVAELVEVDAQAEPDKRFALRSKKGITLLIVAVVVVIALVLSIVYLVRANADDGPDAVAVTVPVALSDVDLPSGSSIGVVLTSGDDTTEGSQWNQAAQGAVVAQQRLELGGNDVTLMTENDAGSSEGSAEAVQNLIDQGVAGIIYASSGNHVADGLAVAEDAEVPVILPYEAAGEDVTNQWSLALGDDEAATTLAAEVGNYERPLHINAGAPLPDAVAVSDEVEFTGETDTTAFGEEMALRTGADPFENGAYTGGGEDEQSPAPVVENPADVVVVSGHPVLQARAVFALQAGNVSVPVVLTQDAVSPSFDQALLEQGGTVSSSLRTVGASWDDGAALGRSGQSRAMSAFLTANRQIADNESLQNLTEDAPFVESAAVTDVRSHDAVLALSNALSDAGNTDPANVAESLSELELAAGDGIAGPQLDFANAQAMTGDATVLHASSQQLGLRPTVGEYSDVLVWISQPEEN